MVRRTLASLLCGLCAVSLLSWRPFSLSEVPSKRIEQPSSRIDFQRDVLPILSSKCFSCHGPDPATRKAGLRLDQREAAVTVGRSGALPIVAGNAKESELVRRIHSEDVDERMPPKKTGKSLSVTEKQVLSQWIAEGAEYQTHWAFVKPQRAKAPNVKNQAWAKNEIDRFILAKLEAAGLEPSPPADPVTLIRRLSLDLTGLPPSVEVVAEFVKAWDAPGAKRGLVWEAAVDRALASPHYGEKMALTWLDLARYGDTSGYHMDSTRQMWLWRDWVIDAFNNDMPFDQFTIEQLAGDLLPADPKRGSDRFGGLSPTIASGFNRNTRFNEEGGVDPEEYVVRYSIDRTNTLGQIWLGLTLGCAECHAHKYDPISHQEYYQLFAYFTGITEPMLEGHQIHGKPLPPLLKFPSAQQAMTLAEQRQTLVLLESAIGKELGRFTYIDPLEGKALPETIPNDLAVRSYTAWLARGRTDDKLPAEIRDLLKIELVQRTDAQNKALKDFYLRKINADGRDRIGALEDEREALAKKVQDLEDAVPHTLITAEMAKPRPAHVLIRGDFQQKGERVERNVPAVLGALPRDAPANRLGLARWLVAPEHPLTARVTVNRLWAQMFGQGIVRTAGDFGTQGDFPSHPALLDWLASELILPASLPAPGESSGAKRAGAPRAWSIKHILRTIALSATYQQSSIHREDSAQVDPHNRLLSFIPRFRLGAEELRDSALTISGLLNPRVGGPSFMPYQPRDYYKFKNEDWPWTASDGDEQYRRGLYAFWRRTALHPMFTMFDAPTREDCTVLRARTNTPLQALVTLNDPTFVEAARVFAQHLLSDGPKDRDARLTLAFRKATCRTPTEAEMQVLRKRFEQQRARFAADADRASTFVSAGQYPRDARMDVTELAAWTALCNMILNLDEVLTRE